MLWCCPDGENHGLYRDIPDKAGGFNSVFHERHVRCLEPFPRLLFHSVPAYYNVISAEIFDDIRTMQAPHPNGVALAEGIPDGGRCLVQ